MPIKREAEYSEMLNLLYDYEDDFKRGIEVTFQVTSDCSLRCTYCYQHNKYPGYMSLETGKKFIDVIFNQLQGKKHHVVLDFIGGEPLLAAKLIADLVDYWDYKCIMEENWTWGALTRVNICSNGTEWDKPEVQKLIHHVLPRLSFTVTIDGNKELHDSARIHPDGRPSYNESKHAANCYEQLTGVEIGSKITIAPQNLPFVYVALKHFMDEGRQQIFANTVYEKGWNLEYAREYYSIGKKVADYKLENYPEIFLSLFDELIGYKKLEGDEQVFCGGTPNPEDGTPTMLACDCEGVLFPCQRYTDISIPTDVQPPLSIGTVDTGIDQDLIDRIGKVTRKTMESGVPSLFNEYGEATDCYSCPIASGCGNCAAYAYEVGGLPIKKTNYMCQMHVARVLFNCYYWNKYYRNIESDQRFKLNVPDSWALQIVSPEELIYLHGLEN